MKSLFNAFSVLLCALAPVQGLIPRLHTVPATWIDAVGAELIQNGILETDKSQEDIWRRLGGPEMVRMSLDPMAPIESVVATLFFAAELTHRGGVLPEIIETVSPVCQKMREVPDLVVNIVDTLLDVLRALRRFWGPLTMHRVVILTPLAHVNLVCGTNNVMAPSLNRITIKSFLQRELRKYRGTEAPPLPEGIPLREAYLEATRIIGHHAVDWIVSGSVSTAHLQVLYEVQFGDAIDALFTKSDEGVYYLNPEKLGKAEYSVAGRAMALSILYGVPTGRKLDPQLVELLCSPEDETALMEYRLFQKGFQEIIPFSVLNYFNIDRKIIGAILLGESV